MKNYLYIFIYCCRCVRKIVYPHAKINVSVETEYHLNNYS